ncbi:GntR family transcriptional regulator [Conexibacter sp. CPCC 206217]|uniref:GntR family transcriptional regulator n=1 Tax=Conexibacter sp. CPCC 206217 TaxID=3064574 RepID=UPI00271692DD|nr:GntR family transcriptional regulator [Conexibacter sp. CPCC 206217]MDO8211035.1 GntR family transcriptional regulator [Conexibacter sp. CPCC 206217]
MSGGPVYQRIRRDLEERIRDGALAPGGRLPSETELSSSYGVTRMTVRQAIGRLVEDGLVVRRHGVGTFVASNSRVRRSLNSLSGFAEELRADGKETTTEVVAQALELPSAELAEELSMMPGEQYVRIERLRSIDGHPTAVQESWVPVRLCPGMDRVQLVDGSLYATLRGTFGISLVWAEQEIRALAATERLAQQLQVDVATPLLEVVRRTFGEGNVTVEHARSWMGPGYTLLTTLRGSEDGGAVHGERPDVEGTTALPS